MQGYRSPALNTNIPDRHRVGVGAREDNRDAVATIAGDACNGRAQGNRKIAPRHIIYPRLQIDAGARPNRHPLAVVPGQDRRDSCRPGIDRRCVRRDLATEKCMRQRVRIRVRGAGRTDQCAWGRAEFR